MERTEYRSTRPSVPLPEPPLSGELPIALPAGARFGVCLTHDVDHLGLREHLVDGFLLRYAANLGRQHLIGSFRPHRALDGWWGIAQSAWGRDRWDATEALLEREQRAGVRSTWFVPIRPGRGIAFGAERAGAIARRIAAAGHEVGLHGQSFDDAERLALEAEQLGEQLGSPVRGLRMHYLRLSRAVLDGMQRAGLQYDSTTMRRDQLDPRAMELTGPRLVRTGLLEIPLHVMDSTLFSVTGLRFDLKAAVEWTRALLRRAAEEGRVIVVNLHPNFYSRQSPEMRDWYDRLLDELTARSDGFVTDMRGLVARVVIE